MFLLGFAYGLALLALTAYRHVSPAWLRWILFATAVGMLARYASIAAFALAEKPETIWPLRHFWFASSVGLTLPSVFAVDQLLRHPALTPTKILKFFSPFLAVYLALIAFGGFTAVPDPVLGWTLKLSRNWTLVVSATQSAFVLLFLAAGVWVLRKVPVAAIRLPVLLLMLAHVCLYFRPFLFSEMAALLCLWYSFESANVQQRTGG